MMLIQVGFGRFTQDTLTCGRCAGSGIEPGTRDGTCMFCGGDARRLWPKLYTYSAPEGTQLWQHVRVPTPRGPQDATVLELGSDYDSGTIKSIILPPPGTMECPGCGRPDVSRQMVCCAPCWRRVPQSLKSDLQAVATAGGTFGEIRRWLKVNPS